MSVVAVLVLLLFSFPVDGGRVGGVPVHLFFVVCYCFLFWIGCVLSNWFFCQAVAGFFVQW